MRIEAIGPRGADVRQVLEQLIDKRDLSPGQAQDLFTRIMAGQLGPAQIAAALTALAAKGETAEEITGAALALRACVTPICCPADAIDTCGTGGDGISTFNVSTTAALIAAAAGVTVAKHGNRSHSRVSGSAEVLRELGVNIDADVPTVERCLEQAHIGFLFAPALHPAMKHAGPVRKALGIRTLFNLLGPLVNPAGVRRQVIGVPRAALTETLAAVLAELGSRHVWVVHGWDGLCDLTITGPTRVTEMKAGQFATFEVTPADVGLTVAPLDALRVDSPAASAARVRDILAGTPGPCRDHAVLNAGAAILIGGRAGDLPAAVAVAQTAIDSGAAATTLEALVRLSHGG